jgi:diketogulonate reductase-like aldo/keto reductase
MDLDRRATLRTLGGFAAAFALKPAPAQSTALVARAIPSTGEKIPTIGVGTWQTFDVGDDAVARAPLKEVLSLLAGAGGRVVDSSPMYGASESVLGDLAAELGIRDKLFVATKIWVRGRDEGVRQMERSFERLRLTRMDLMQVHNLQDVAVHTRTLLDWKHSGRIRYLGITHYASSAYAEIERLLKTGQYDFLQINYSLGERESENRLLPLAQNRRIAVIANRPFAEGAMFRRVRGKALPEWTGELGIASWAQYFLKWTLGHPAITCAIPGTAKPEHMADNLAAGYGAMPDAGQRRRMLEHYDSL